MRDLIYPPAKIYTFDCMPVKSNLGAFIRDVIKVVYNMCYLSVLASETINLLDNYNEDTIPIDVAVEITEQIDKTNIEVIQGIKTLENYEL